jgi:PAS domain S-box-containing protein
MRRKIVVSLLVVFLCSALGAALAAYFMRTTTATLSRLIDLHQVAELRQHLIIAIQASQSDLYTVHTALGKEVDLITSNVAHLDEAVGKCSGCHHAPEVAARLEGLKTLTSDYQVALSYYITASANQDRIWRLKMDAAAIGGELLRLTEEMSIQSFRGLERSSVASLRRIDVAKEVLYLATLVALLLVVAVSIYLTTSVTHPIDRLVTATRAIASGELGYRLPEDDRTEFGELAHHFNTMSAELKKGYAELEAQVQERRHAEDSLRLSEERLRFALDATSEVVWDWNLAEDAIYQPRWAQTFGYPADATPRTGEQLRRFIHPEELPLFDSQFGQLLKGTRATLEVEHRVRTFAGEWKWMMARAHVVERNDLGEAVRVVGTCADVTERRRMLERLHLADRMASVGTLAAGVAHEINNPLAYVLANLGFALEELARPDQAPAGPAAPPVSPPPALARCREALQEAEVGATRVRDIVRALKVFSRADEEALGRVDVLRALKSALQFADPEIRHRARLVRRLGPVPPITGNETRLTQVFVNLLVNAAQAIPEGNVEQNEIRVETRVAAGGNIVIEVQDSGCGMSPEVKKRIFDPFFTTKPVGEGTGLGLAICHGIVTSLGGEMEVESEAGKGALFRVSLPPGAETVEPQVQAPPRRSPGRRGSILVVDDEPLFNRAMERLLQPEHDVIAISDPREALRRLVQGERFDLVIGDLSMPQMTGMQFHDELARIAPRLAAGMLFVSGGAFTAEAADFVARWRDRVLDKPFSAAAVLLAVTEALERASAPSA